MGNDDDDCPCGKQKHNLCKDVDLGTDGRVQQGWLQIHAGAFGIDWRTTHAKNAQRAAAQTAW